jgi:multidrug resistance protein, MATE family
MTRPAELKSASSTLLKEPAANASISSATASATPLPPTPGGSKELLTLAAPLVLSQGFMTAQVFLDTILLSWHDSREMAASFPGVMWFWLLFSVLQMTAGYTSTFVAQYSGAQRPHRVGPAVWQGIRFSVLAGLLFLVVIPAAPFLIAVGGHSPALQELEVAYLRCLTFAAMPMLLMAAVNGFFSGRGQTWTVLAIEALGTAVNMVLALILIFGRLGFPELGIVGAGWATVAGSWASALFAVALLLRATYRIEFATWSGRHFDRALFMRLMRYGGPAGVQVFLDVLVFHIFTQMLGRLGETAMAATTLTVRLNMLAFLPMLGMGQAVSILVGQRLGADRPDLAERSAYTGLRWAFTYMCVIATAYLTLPATMVGIFESHRDPEQFEAVATTVRSLLICVAMYSLADSVNVTFSSALRGAGDTRFVSLLTFALAWPLMVIPTFIVVQTGGTFYWAWGAATAYIMAMAVCFYLRFRAGKWKSMRVIEPAVEEEEPPIQASRER